MKLSEIYYSNKFDDLDNQLKNFINQEKHVIFIDSKLSSIINLDPKFKIFEIEINESTKDSNFALVIRIFKCLGPEASAVTYGTVSYTHLTLPTTPYV